MKRTVLFGLGFLGLAAAFLPSRALAQVAQPGTFNCYKAKDLKTPQFAASTFGVLDEFGAQTETAKKPFLYCTKVGSSPNQILSCYKVSSGGFAAGSNRTVTDSFGVVDVSVKKKPFVFCNAGTGAP